MRSKKLALRRLSFYAGVFFACYVAAYGFLRWQHLLIRTARYYAVAEDNSLYADSAIRDGFYLRDSLSERSKKVVSRIGFVAFRPLCNAEAAFRNRYMSKVNIER